MPLYSPLVNIVPFSPTVCLFLENFVFKNNYTIWGLFGGGGGGRSLVSIIDKYFVRIGGFLSVLIGSRL